MMAKGRDVVAGREFLHDLHVRGQACPSVNSLEQIMAEQGGLRHASVERGLEGVHVVDALACKGAFAKQVLVDVGNRGGVGIDACRARKDPQEQRPLMAHRQ